MESINEKIKRLRKQKGISQYEVAQCAGISQPSFASFEKGDTKSISIEVGKGISKALDIDFNELFDIESNGKKIKELQNQIDSLNIDLDIQKTRAQQLYRQIAFLHQELLEVFILAYEEHLINFENETNSCIDETEKEKIQSLRMEYIDKQFYKKKEYIDLGMFTEYDFADFYRNPNNPKLKHKLDIVKPLKGSSLVQPYN